MNICIVTTRHISYNPRVLKEADALTEAGHTLTVVAINNHPAYHKEDWRLMASRSWQLLTVNYRRQGLRESLRWLWTGVRKKIYEQGSQLLGFNHGIAERAQGREYPELLRLACGQPADLYIAHHPEALGAAFHAAKKHGAKFAFDAEDFHSGELSEGVDPAKVKRIEYLELKYLPQCDYVTAASECIAEALAEKYSISRPETIENVFPLDSFDSQKDTKHREHGISLYWYSQVIGPGRGLEEAVLALNKLHWPCELHLRGTMMPGFGEKLQSLAQNEGSANRRLFFHAPASPDDLVRLAAEHDIGLALETGENLNRMLCVTNKLFVYMLAGLGIVASDTPGQMRIMEQVPDAGVVCKRRDVDSLAAAIEQLISNPEKLAQAKKASREAAEKRFNWDAEKEKLVRVVEGVLSF